MNNLIENNINNLIKIRKDIHSHPELGYQEVRTSTLIAEKLKEYGVDEIHTKLAKTGVVGVIYGNKDSDDTIGIRADIDALPIMELNKFKHISTIKGKMHACGHDGHTTMALGTAQYLCQNRNFKGKVYMIFQPAEEGGAGAEKMIKEGLFTKFDIKQVYGVHNLPGLDIAAFATRSGPIMAAADTFDITIKGVGGHAATPHDTIDPLLIASNFVVSVQSIVSRQTDPVDPIVISITQLHSGFTHNIIPNNATLQGTVRTFSAHTRKIAEQKIKHMANSIADSYGAKATIEYHYGYPVVINTKQETDLTIQAAEKVFGKDHVNPQINMSLGGEDFAYMLIEKPGSMGLIGNGNSAGLHSPYYDFNDEAIPHGIRYWVSLVETVLGHR